MTKTHALALAVAVILVSPFAGAKPVARRDDPKLGRFIDRGDYVEDSKTGLLWQKDGMKAGKMNFYQAADYAKKLTIGNLGGWRVPSKEEVAAIFPATEAPFTNTPYNPGQCCQGPMPFDSYWTSELDPRLPDYAYVYHWYNKGGANNCSASFAVYVRCVHDPVKR